MDGLRAAVYVLRGAPLDDGHLSGLEAVAADRANGTRHRLRALRLLSRSRWRQLAALMQARVDADPALQKALDDALAEWTRTSAGLGQGPDPATRSRVQALLPTLDGLANDSIAFVLRTSR